MTGRIAVLGGSFNPFCKHHQEIIRFVVEQAGFQTVLVVPAAAHALKDDLAPYLHRYNMAKLGVEDLLHNGVPSLPFRASVRVSQIEMDMMRRQPPPVRTYELLREVRKGYPDEEIKFVIGPDIPDELDQWEKVDQIRDEFGFFEVPVQSMRATKLRGMISDGLRAWKQHVPLMVARYIEMHGLYHVERTTCDHEWVPTLVQTLQHPHLEACSKCNLPRPGSEIPDARTAP